MALGLELGILGWVMQGFIPQKHKIPSKDFLVGEGMIRGSPTPAWSWLWAG